VAAVVSVTEIMVVRTRRHQFRGTARQIVVMLKNQSRWAAGLTLEEFMRAEIQAYAYVHEYPLALPKCESASKLALAFIDELCRYGLLRRVA
jgi:hypothetical protein